MLLDFLSKFSGTAAALDFIKALQVLEGLLPTGAKDYAIDEVVAYLQSLKGK